MLTRVRLLRELVLLQTLQGQSGIGTPLLVPQPNTVTDKSALNLKKSELNIGLFYIHKIN